VSAGRLARERPSIHCIEKKEDRILRRSGTRIIMDALVLAMRKALAAAGCEG